MTASQRFPAWGAVGGGLGGAAPAPDGDGLKIYIVSAFYSFIPYSLIFGPFNCIFNSLYKFGFFNSHDHI